ncbi:AMP-binding protein [Actinomadura madurae]|uniref:AMP-binding protein n=1 Tax=Actinomadura madurae TaxID=1993 RepID=UPI003557AF2F
MFASLASGGTLHIPDEDTVLSPAAVRAFMAEHRIDRLKAVPSHLAALGTDVLPGGSLVLGGEAPPPELVAELVAGDRAVFNHYGPTETTIGVATARLTPELVEAGVVPIGSPVANTRVYVLDDRLRPVPVGVAGELYVAGVQVARCYVGGRGSPPSGSWPARSPARASGCTAPATWRAGRGTGCWSSPAGPTTRSRSAASGSSPARSGACWPGTRA